jgi:hypothetical protein
MISKTIWIGAVRHLALAIVAGCLTIAALSTAGAQTPDKARHMIDGVRDARYCELIPVVRHGVHLIATVYNTLGLNDCPPDLWDKITEAAMKEALRRAQGGAQRPAPFRHGCDRGRGRHRRRSGIPIEP